MSPAVPPPGSNPRPACVLCKFYFMTYEPNMPHGCNLFGFKSQQLPTVAVKNESGEHCGHFEKRPAR